MEKCPICGQATSVYHEVTFREPYVHNMPFEGLMIYGAYSAPKTTICHENNFLHFAFFDSEGQLVDHTLVQLGVQNPTTKTPSEEYMEGAQEVEPIEEVEDGDDSDLITDKNGW